MKTTLENLENAFQLGYDMMFRSGGDGSVYFNSEAYKKYADLFEAWLTKNSNDFLGRKDYPEDILFVNDQEYVVFSGKIDATIARDAELTIWLPEYYADLIERETI